MEHEERRLAESREEQLYVLLAIRRQGRESAREAQDWLANLIRWQQ